MIVIKRGSAPHELTKEVKTLLPDQRKYDNLSSLTKTALKESLLKSQGFLCAYCMCQIKDVKHAKLEHVYPQARSIKEGHPEKTIAYDNMLATCMGNADKSGSRQNQTCDSHKGDKLISIDPTSQNHIDTISYGRDGKIQSSNTEFNDDLCETLNLNCRKAYLPQRREGAYKSIQKAIERHNPKTHEAKQAFARRKLEELESAAVKEPFIGVMIYRLKKWSR